MIRDREAGMVFPWRGGGSGNTGGLTLAVCLATLIFGLAFVGFSMRVDKKVPTTRRSAEIMLVEGDDPRLVDWMDGSSPFPSRWNPEESSDMVLRVANALDGELRALAVREFDWRKLPKIEKGVDTPKIYKSAELIFPPLPDYEEVKSVKEGVQLEVAIEIFGDGVERFPEEVKMFGAEIPAGEYGKQWRWLLSLGSDGRVVHCVPVEPLDDDFALKLERWLWIQVFKEGKNGEVIDVMVGVVRKEVEDD